LRGLLIGFMTRYRATGVPIVGVVKSGTCATDIGVSVVVVVVGRRRARSSDWP
jgi:hypothetical protein